MPRAGLTPAAVVDAAIALVDRDGPEALTLTAVADRLGVRAPSLYNHVDSLDDLRTRAAARSLTDLADALEGSAGDDDPRTFLHAYRQWARSHPARYALLPVQPTPAGEPHEPATVAPSIRLVELATTWAGRFDLHDDAAIHAARALRSAMHGFCTIETAGGFGLPVDIEDSFQTLVDLLIAGLRASSTTGPPRTVKD
jgi:AcrR family transcriptional regulator